MIAERGELLLVAYSSALQVNAADTLPFWLRVLLFTLHWMDRVLGLMQRGSFGYEYSSDPPRYACCMCCTVIIAEFTRATPRGLESGTKSCKK